MKGKFPEPEYHAEEYCPYKIAWEKLKEEISLGPLICDGDDTKEVLKRMEEIEHERN